MSLARRAIFRPPQSGRRFNFYYVEQLKGDVGWILESQDNFSLPYENVGEGSDLWSQYRLAYRDLVLGRTVKLSKLLFTDGTDIKNAKCPEIFSYQYVVPVYYGLRVKINRIYPYTISDPSAYPLNVHFMQNFEDGVSTNVYYWYDVLNQSGVDFSLNPTVGDQYSPLCEKMFLDDHRYKMIRHSPDCKFDVNVGMELPFINKVNIGYNYINGHTGYDISLSQLLNVYFRDGVIATAMCEGVPGSFHMNFSPPQCLEEYYYDGTVPVPRCGFIVEMEVIHKLSLSCSYRWPNLLQWDIDFPSGI